VAADGPVLVETQVYDVVVAVDALVLFSPVVEDLVESTQVLQVVTVDEELDFELDVVDELDPELELEPLELELPLEEPEPLK
jgi:hypothetical protein